MRRYSKGTQEGHGPVGVRVASKKNLVICLNCHHMGNNEEHFFKVTRLIKIILPGGELGTRSWQL